MAVYMTAQWKCRPGAESKVEKALRRFVASVKQNEPATIIYTALQQAAYFCLTRYKQGQLFN